MFALLIPILTTILPEIGKLIFGSTGEVVTNEAMKIVRVITGKDNPSPSDLNAAISDPRVEADLRVQLAKIAADQEAAKEQADIARQEAQLNEIRATLADVASARSQTVDLAKSGSAIAWGAPVISGITLVAFGLVTYVLMTKQIPTNESTMLIVGALIAMAQSVVSYWVGSSSGSAAKANQIERMMGNQK